MKFRKKPVVIEAFMFGADVEPDWFKQSGVEYIYWHDDDRQPPSGAKIDTLEGVMTAYVGDWIIKGIKGELYPCKADIFEATYEPYQDLQTAEEYFSKVDKE
jgi:hypothetical protein